MFSGKGIEYYKKKIKSFTLLIQVRKMYKGIKINKILVAVDGSENSKRAGDYAIKLGKDLHADVIALHVIPTGKYIDEGNLEKGSKYDYAYLDKFGKESESAGVHLEIDIKRATRSSVVDEILEYGNQKNIDLIVIEIRSVSEFRFMLGSTASGVVVNAPCPVLVVK